ncbi:MAG: hypothetical protein JOZ99_03310 [Actinobacteria bacterium]|nr:hypothetical protein [Actinomycetota bacterium]
MEGEANQPAAVLAWARANAVWLIAGAVALVAVLTGFALSSGGGPAAPRVKGQQLTRPDAGGTTTTSPAGATTTSSSTAAAASSTSTPVAGGTVNGSRSTSTTAKGSTRNGAPGTAAPAAVPPELGPALTATRVLSWSPGIVGQAGGDVWAVDTLDSGRVARVDANHALAAGQVQPFVSGLAPVADGAWVLRSTCPTGRTQLVHLDRAANDVATLDIAQPVVCDLGPGRTALAATSGALWIATKDPARSGFGLLVDVDPATGAVVDRLSFAGAPHDVQADGSAVWITLSDVPSVSSDDLVLAAVDPSTRRETTRTIVHAPFGFPIVRGGDIWAGGANGLRRIPPGGAEQVYAVGGNGCGGGQLFGFVPGAVTANTVWGTRLDLVAGGPTGPVTHQSVCRIDLPGGTTTGWSPGALQIVGGDDAGAWLADPVLGGLVRWTTT